MNQALIFIAGLIIGGAMVWAVKKRPVVLAGSEKEQGKAWILEVVAENERITNDEVEKLLKVSDATATRYLDELEKEGKIRQIGKTGRSVYYAKQK